MSKKSLKFDTPDTRGWQVRCDDLFLASYRGLPCSICHRTHVMSAGRRTRSCGHHLLEKDQCRCHRYNPDNIIVLCADHHGKYDREYSPHSDYTGAVAMFYYWLWNNSKTMVAFIVAHRADKWDKSWTYKEMYVRLGGKIEGELIKDQKPVGHSAVRDAIEAGNL